MIGHEPFISIYLSTVTTPESVRNCDELLTVSLSDDETHTVSDGTPENDRSRDKFPSGFQIMGETNTFPAATPQGDGEPDELPEEFRSNDDINTVPDTTFVSVAHRKEFPEDFWNSEDMNTAPTGDPTEEVINVTFLPYQEIHKEDIKSCCQEKNPKNSTRNPSNCLWYKAVLNAIEKYESMTDPTSTDGKSLSITWKPFRGPVLSKQEYRDDYPPRIFSVHTNISRKLDFQGQTPKQTACCSKSRSNFGHTSKNPPKIFNVHTNISRKLELRGPTQQHTTSCPKTTVPSKTGRINYLFSISIPATEAEFVVDNNSNLVNKVERKRSEEYASTEAPVTFLSLENAVPLEAILDESGAPPADPFENIGKQ